MTRHERQGAREEFSTVATGGGGITQAYADAHYLQVSGANGMVGLLDISNAAAGQIKFPATPNLSADAHTLDAYEEGTWTPTIVPSTSGTITLATGAAFGGSYTRIGNVVTVWARLFASAVAAPVGFANVLGLPFTVQGSAGLNYAGAITADGMNVSAATDLQVFAQSGQTRAQIWHFAAGVRATAAADFKANSDCNITMTHRI